MNLKIRFEIVHICTILLCALLSVTALPAYAGWDLTLENTGSISSPSFNGTINTIPISNSNNPFTVQRQSTDVTVTGVVKIKLIWSGGGSPTTPPKSIKIIAGAGGGAFVNTTGTVSVNNGFGDAQSTFPNNYPWYGTSTTMNGTHLVKVPPSTGTSINVTTVNMNAFGPSGATVSATVSIDDRAVSIGRSGARGEITDSNGNKHGDTTYSYLRIWDYGQDLMTNWQPFAGAYSGSWTSSTSVAWSPAYSGATSTSNQVSMPFGSMNLGNGWEGIPTGPNEYRITYTASDPTDGASASETYTLHLHDHKENLQFGRIEDLPDEVYESPIGQGANDVEVVATWTWTGTLTGKIDFNFNGALAIPEFGTLGGSIAPGFTLSGSVAGANSIHIPPHMKAFPQVLVQRANSYYTFDEFDEAGLVGEHAGFVTTKCQYVCTWSELVPL
jgi:hypothetical protein